MKILITGSSGFLAPYLMNELKKHDKNLNLIGLVKKNRSKNQFDRELYKEFIGDISNKKSLKPIFEQSLTDPVSVVFHLASSVSLYSTDRENLELVNILGTQNIIELCREFKVQRLIHVSSVAAVGASSTGCILLNENSKHLFRSLDFINIETKIKSEALVLEACRRNEIDAVIVNPSMIFGAGDAKKPPRIGNILAAQGKMKFYTHGGLSVVGVQDVVTGMIAAWKKGRKGERYILSGENLSMKEVLTLYAEFGGGNPPQFKIPTSLLRLLGQIMSLLPVRTRLNRESAMTATLFHWFDHTKAKNELDFHPAPARQAIQDSFQWMKENGYLISKK